jgi:hypothetical protein
VPSRKVANELGGRSEICKSARITGILELRFRDEHQLEQLLHACSREVAGSDNEACEAWTFRTARAERQQSNLGMQQPWPSSWFETRPEFVHSWDDAGLEHVLPTVPRARVTHEVCSASSQPSACPASEPAETLQGGLEDVDIRGHRDEDDGVAR